jgi:hypothetical protein
VLVRNGGGASDDGSCFRWPPVLRPVAAAGRRQRGAHSMMFSSSMCPTEEDRSFATASVPLSRGLRGGQGGGDGWGYMF